MAFCAKYCYLFILAVVYFNVSLFDSVWLCKVIADYGVSYQLHWNFERRRNKPQLREAHAGLAHSVESLTAKREDIFHTHTYTVYM